jgi:Transposase DDE domain
MIGPVHIEVALAAGYAGFLIVVAAGLEWFGRHSHWRSGQFRTAGFKYHGHLDVWECPCGHHLRPHYRDPVREVVRYRAPAHTCNACARKNECTESEHGREIIHSSESWIETEAGKFHRVLSLTLLLLAALIMIAEMLRHPTFPEVLLPGSVLALVLTRGLSLARELLAKQNREGSESVRAAFGNRRI